MTKNILVADDMPSICESLKESLAPFYNVDVATNGIEVLEHFEQKTYAGLIIDVTFEKGMNGLMIASRLRTRHKNLKIIVFSATDYNDAVRQQVVDMGAAFCVKPLEPDFVRHIMEG